jgi:hypothetical protein
VVGKITLKKATSALSDALANLPKLAKQLEGKSAAVAPLSAAALSGPPIWSLVLDEIEDSGFDLRPRLPFKGRALTGPARKAAKVTGPLSSVLVPLVLDALTVVDDPSFLGKVASEKNLPGYVKTGLPPLY